MPQGADPHDFTNQFLIAMPGMADDQFAGTVVYVCEHSPQGALGLIVNKPMELNLASLFEKVDLPLDRPVLAAQPVYFGGPVQTERGFVLHEPQAETFMSTLVVPGGLAMTTSKDVLEALAAGAGPQRVLLTLGYCGWSSGQLEREIGHNGWLTVTADAGVIFDLPPEARYQGALNLLGVDARMLSKDAGHA